MRLPLAAAAAVAAARRGAVAIALAGLLAWTSAGVSVAAPVAQVGVARASLGAAKVPGWRVVASGRIPHRESLLVSVDAPAASNAWAVGFSLLTKNPELDRSALLVKH